MSGKNRFNAIHAKLALDRLDQHMQGCIECWYSICSIGKSYQQSWYYYESRKIITGMNED